MARPRRNPDLEILIARDSAVIVVDGIEEHIVKGQTRARASHPIVKAAPGFWEPIRVHYDVEQATATPGKRRAG